MNLFKVYLISTLLMLSFSFLGCEGDNSDTPVSTAPDTSSDTTTLPTVEENTVVDVITAILPVSSAVLTKNAQSFNIVVKAIDSKNRPYSSGNIEIVFPNDVREGRDIGYFNKFVSTLDEQGEATFVYTAPLDLDANTSNILFGFFHDENPTEVLTYTMTIVPDENQIVNTVYKITTGVVTDVTMLPEDVKSVNYSVVDENGNAVTNDNITNITVTTLNPSVGTLRDGSVVADSLTFDTNNISLNVLSNTLSGIIPIQVDAVFNDKNGLEQNLTSKFNVIVLSGAPTAMSLSYAGTSQNSDTAKFVENWVLTVTDKYNNLVNTTPAIATGLITGYAQSSAPTSNIANYLYYESATNDGNLTDGTTDILKSANNVFDNIDLVNDKLALFGGTGYKFNAYGKWDIDSFTSNELTLKDDYNGSAVTALTYVVGHNFRNEWCDGSPVVANVYAKDNNYILPTTGSMIIQVEYDYYLVGKSVVLWTNLIGESNNTTTKIGLAEKITLRGEGLNGDEYSYAKGFSGVVRLNININNTVEPYQNANFTYLPVVTGDDTNWTLLGDSMSEGNITDCLLNGGVGYVDINITDPAGKAGVIKLISVLPSREF